MNNKLNLEKLNKLGLITDNKCNEKFYSVYNIYYKLLLKYIDRKLYLSKYDSNISCFELRIKPTNIKKDFTSELSFLKFFSIKSLLHIENLTSDDIDMLYKRYSDNDFDFNKETITFIESTISSITENSDIILSISYGYNNSDEIERENINKFVDEEIKKLEDDIKNYSSFPISITKEIESSNEKTDDSIKK